VQGAARPLNLLPTQSGEGTFRITGASTTPPELLSVGTFRTTDAKTII
jgi:hypothetical protein